MTSSDGCGETPTALSAWCLGVIGLRTAGVTGAIDRYGSMQQALAGARSLAAEGDLILIFGSFVIVGEALALLQGTSQPELI